MKKLRATLMDRVTRFIDDWTLPRQAAGENPYAEGAKSTLSESWRPRLEEADTIGTGLKDVESDIPGALYQHLGGGTEVAHHKSYKSLRAAEEDFQAAFAAARAGGWDPEAEREAG